LAAVAIAATFLTGCDRAAEDRAADAAQEAVRQTNRALNKAGEIARDGSQEAMQAARKAGEVAKEGAAEAGRMLGDGGLTARVKTALLADESVKAANIDVDSNSGVVTLSGRLSSQAEVDRAVEIVRGIDGVTQVENRLTTGGA
jgi:hyperosmotically inducible protein